MLQFLATQRTLHFRPAKRPTLSLPLTVRSVGHYQLMDSFPAERPRRKDIYELFWSCQGTGRVELAGESRVVGPGDCFFYRPGDVHDVRVESTRWEYHWVTFDGDASSAFFAALPPPFSTQQSAPWAAGSCPAETFHAVADAVNDPTPAGERRASAHAYRLIIAAWFGPLNPDPHHPLAAEARSWLSLHFAEESITIEQLATVCGVHRSTLFRAFQLAYGLSPSEYLSGLRIQHGLRLLKETTLRVKEISHRCGFADPNYFTRAVRQAKKMSPLAFRSSDD